MNKYYFDTNARIRFWVDAKTEQEAIDLYSIAINDAKGLKIDVDTYTPETVKESDNEENE